MHQNQNTSGLTPTPPPDRLVHPQSEWCAEISRRLDACKMVRLGLKRRSASAGWHSTPESSEMWPCRTSVWVGDLCFMWDNWHKVTEEEEKGGNEVENKYVWGHLENISLCSCSMKIWWFYSFKYKTFKEEMLKINVFPTFIALTKHPWKNLKSKHLFLLLFFIRFINK